MTTSDLAHLAWAQTWQLTALIVVTAVVTRLAGKRQPHLAHILWLVVLAKSLTPPVIASAGGVFSWLQPASDSTSARVEQREALLSRAQAHQGAAPTADDDAAFEARTDDIALEATLLSRDDFAGAPVARMGALATIPNTGPTAPWLLDVVGWCGCGWIAGSVSLFVLAFTRWGVSLRTIRTASVVARPDLDSLVAELSRRLRLGKPVRLVVTESRLGPAVVGFLHPVILLPLAVVRGKSARELEAILAHELIHVRRGDLWIGLVQLVSQAVWWFHPLVWLANRRATRAAEACCDEEVVAELGCDPASYAGSLLDVLELKRRLISVPAFPGMKPVDVTRERLERIMQTGQGCRRTTPWWCWIVLVLTAAATLPGAALQLSAENPQQKKTGKPIAPGEFLMDLRNGQSASRDTAAVQENAHDAGGKASVDPPLKNLGILKGTGIKSGAGIAGTIVLTDEKPSRTSATAGPAENVASKPKPELSTVTYSVADLVILSTPLQLTLWPTDDAKLADRSQALSDVDPNGNRVQNGYREHHVLPGDRDPPGDKKANYAPLIELIQATTGREQWDDVGGVGSIRTFDATLSLVVRNTQDVQDEIGELLRQLRQLHNLQAVLHLEVFHLPAGSSKATIPDNALLEAAQRGLDATKDQLDQLRSIIAGGKGKWITQSVKFTVQNSQRAELALRCLRRQDAEQAPLLQLGTAIAPDRSTVRLHVAIGAANAVDALARSRTFIVKDRRPLLLDITDDIQSGRLGLPVVEPLIAGKRMLAERMRGWGRTLLLITAQIVVREEEQAVGIPAP